MTEESIIAFRYDDGHGNIELDNDAQPIPQIVYTLSLRTDEEHAANDRRILDTVAQTWRFFPCRIHPKEKVTKTRMPR